MTEILGRFSPVVPGQEQRELLDVKEALFGNVALKLERLLPEGREKALVMTRLEEAAMWASRAILASRCCDAGPGELHRDDCRMAGLW